MNAEPVSAVICAVGEQLYAIPVNNILEVAALVRLTSLPDAPEEILGVVNRQGQVIPVLDLRLCLGKKAGQIDLSTLFIVVQGAGYTAGLIVDDVREVTSLPAQAMQLSARSGPYIQGMTVIEQAPVLVLDTAALLRTFAPSDLAVGRNE
jgi:purine-binding chemotaxis protein CheW